MKTEQSGKGREYFKDLPNIDFGKLLDEVKKRGYLFYRSSKKEGKDEGKK